VDYETLSGLNPRLIYCSITGYGQTGPKRDEAGHDVNYLATAGVLDLIGETTNPPTIPGVQIADIMGGAMQAAVGILLALYHREKSGRGQYIDISMTDGILGLLTLPRFFQQVRGESPHRSDTTLSHRFGCYNTYRTADGRHVAIGAVENRFWKKLCELLGAGHYGSLQYSTAHRQEIIDWLRTVFATKPLSHWQELLGGQDVCFSTIAEFDEVMASPLFREREMICEYLGEDGCSSSTLGIPIKLSATPGALRTPPAAFGAHTDSVLQELGFYPEQIAGLYTRKII
jgi:crotonobetainyl-CoA:carnitine CoA-transferase CaiB-like acyl-CoA transferase